MTAPTSSITQTLPTQDSLDTSEETSPFSQAVGIKIKQVAKNYFAHLCETGSNATLCEPILPNLPSDELWLDQALRYSITIATREAYRQTNEKAQTIFTNLRILLSSLQYNLRLISLEIPNTNLCPLDHLSLDQFSNEQLRMLQQFIIKEQKTVLSQQEKLEAAEKRIRELEAQLQKQNDPGKKF